MKRILFYLVFLVVLTSCDDFLEVGFNTSELDTELVFENDNTALAALEGIYHELQSSGFASGNIQSVTFLGNVLADDAIDYNNTNDRYDFYTNSLRADNSTNYNIWSSAYKQLYNTNVLLEGIKENVDLSEATKNRIKGEAKFLRAFIYYYLVHLYDGVPLVLTTDYHINQNLACASTSEAHTQIQKDLEEALIYLPEDYVYSNNEHIRPTKYAAHTLLARLALWNEEYTQAVNYASKVIDSGKYSLTELDDVFKANSSESIWQLVPVMPNTGANEGNLFILQNNPNALNNRSSQSLTKDFLSIWEANDFRYQNWIAIYTEGNDDYYYPYKYKFKVKGGSEEYSMVLRLAELYLIRAEGYAKNGNPELALNDLNSIRNRAGLANRMITEVTDIEQTVLDERRRELFSEWGHRWLDLRRFGKSDEVLGQKKPTWQPHAKLLPIPEQDILRNPFLTQNSGY
ncbi:RagB/SusD family nutrient uptake outer membrane protein [Gelidibacter gilvus]|uniref:Type IV secretion system putative lipoprotein virB7 n=1 Tax=Gelidibacter gilvus TaxID=59602 RepID=A0A4Q0XD33_9FLAO|nr:RagB/SusD family nutrient uptake outer membrane protein [Gelidibacter gilvus]RXJ45388.1 RagB/SusD family nutrient uptake outer membrane protein [Gelidibacter gilvus]